MKIMFMLFTVFGVTMASSNAFAHGGWTPLPKDQQLATLLVSSNGWSGIIITTDGKVIAETYSQGHELPDTGEDRVVATLSQADLRQVLSQVKETINGTLGNSAEHWDWNPLFGGVYHVYSANQQSTLLKRWGGRDLSSVQPGYHYAEANDSTAAENLADLLDSLYSKYFGQ